MFTYSLKTKIAYTSETSATPPILTQSKPSRAESTWTTKHRESLQLVISHTITAQLINRRQKMLIPAVTCEWRCEVWPELGDTFLVHSLHGVHRVKFVCVDGVVRSGRADISSGRTCQKLVRRRKNVCRNRAEGAGAPAGCGFVGGLSFISPVHSLLCVCVCVCVMAILPEGRADLQRLPLLYRTLEIQSSNLRRDTGHIDWHFC
jgi:hypothetical protein